MLIASARRRIAGIMACMFPARPAREAARYSPLAVPFQFNPCLGFVQGLVAVAAVFARILTLCVVFAVWGVLSLLGWGRIASPWWRAAAAVPILLALPTALIPPMLAIGSLERRLRPRDPSAQHPVIPITPPNRFAKPPRRQV